MAILVGSTALVDSRVLSMGAAVVGRAGYKVGTVMSGYRPGSRVEGSGNVSLHSHRPSLAIDIAATGDKLTRLGQAALALAGVPNAHQYKKWDGQPTPRGWEIIFHSQEGGNHETHLHLGYEGSSVAQPQFSLPGMAPVGHYDFRALMQLWVNNGGNPQHAAMAAQVASLESGGRPDAHNKTIREDSRGLWQVNIKSNAHPEYASSNLYDPTVNVHAAIKISRNGTQWSQWSTANAARAALAARGHVDVPDRSRPGGSDGGGGGDGSPWWAVDIPGGGQSLLGILGGGLNPFEGLVKLIGWLIDPKQWLRLTEFIIGFALVLLGLATLVVEFSKRGSVVGSASRALTNRVPLGRQLTDFERGAERGVRERDYNEGRRTARQQETRSNPEEFRPRARYSRRRG